MKGKRRLIAHKRRSRTGWDAMWKARPCVGPVMLYLSTVISVRSWVASDCLTSTGQAKLLLLIVMSQPRATATAPIAVEGVHRGSTAAPRRHLIERLGSIDPDRIVTSAPEEPFRLTFIDVTCLLINRTIGSSIYPAARTRLLLATTRAAD